MGTLLHSDVPKLMRLFSLESEIRKIREATALVSKFCHDAAPRSALLYIRGLEDAQTYENRFSEQLARKEEYAHRQRYDYAPRYSEELPHWGHSGGFGHHRSYAIPSPTRRTYRNSAFASPSPLGYHSAPSSRPQSPSMARPHYEQSSPFSHAQFERAYHQRRPARAAPPPSSAFTHQQRATYRPHVRFNSF